MASSMRGGQTNGPFCPRQAGADYAVREFGSIDTSNDRACMASDEVATRGLVPAASVLPCNGQPPVLVDLQTAVRAGWNAAFWSCGNSDIRLRMIIVLRSEEHALLRSFIKRPQHRAKHAAKAPPCTLAVS